MVCLQDEVLFLRKRKTAYKDVWVTLYKKRQYWRKKTEKLELKKKGIKKILIRDGNCPFMENYLSFIFLRKMSFVIFIF